jgi:hypothetical protein
MGRPKGSKNKPKVTESAPVTTKTNNTENTNNTVRQRTAVEMKEWYEKNAQNTQNAFKQLRDVSKTGRQTTLNSYSKDNVVSYLQNISSNESSLRNLSRYLFYRSQVYFRLVMYNATMFDLNARTVIPQYDPTKDNDPKKILKSYYETLQWLDRMNLQHEFLSVFINNFIEDVFFGCCWIDETGIFILQLPPENCKINGKYFTGDFSYSVDMSYYKKYEYLLEYLGEPLSSMYNAYGGDNAKRWQPMPDEYALCTKYRLESWETICPPYSGLFMDLIGLLNLADVQAVADEQQIYKLLTATIPLLDGSDVPDDWAVDIDTALDYYRKLEASLPDYVGSAITPIPLDVISFSEDQTTDTTKIQKATKEVLNTSGGAQILNSSTISGAEAFRSATRADSELAISSLLGQVNGWTNRMLSYLVSNPSKVKFFEVSAYTKDAFKESLQKDLNYGFVSALAINSLNGFSELDTLALNFLERDVLQLDKKFIPLATAATQSGANSESGAPEKSDTEISDEGDETRDKGKNDN